LNSTERGTVWVVDDSPLESELARRLLEPEYTVRTFADGASLLEAFATAHRPDVLILDWHMPGLSGLELCQFLRKQHTEVSLPILVLTATAGREAMLEALSAGANDFVMKEFDPAELVARVRTLVRARRLHDSVEHAELVARQAQQAAEEANRAKDVFMATVSHELRTPLNAILGWANLLTDNALDATMLRRGLDTIQRNAKIQVQLIEDILDTTRVVSGKLHLELSAVHVPDVVRAAVDSVKPALDQKRLKLELELDESLNRIRGDADRLQQMVWNLLTNAIKFTPADGVVAIRATQVGADIEVSVSDSGLGIAPGFLPHVFDRFRQEDGAATRRYSGLGLGLALVKHIVQAHGGTVTAESAGEGRGATFRARLPIGEPASQLPVDLARSTRVTPSEPWAAGVLAGLEVLVVEDDPDARELLVVVLAQQGASVRSASCYDDALQRIAQLTPDVLVSDIGLPVQSGYELLARVRELGHTPDRLPAIALTAYARREDMVLALRAGFQAHLPKPMQSSELIAVVAQVTGRSQPLVEAKR